MVKKNPKGYNKRQQDKHQERVKNRMKKQRNNKTIIRTDERRIEEIATDFSQLIIEKTKLISMLKKANSMNNAYLKENQHFRKQITVTQRTITCLYTIIVCLVVTLIFIIF
jgi:chemotaxis protein histidine kinase CheA